MQILAVLVRTTSSEVDRRAFAHAEQIIQVSKEHGHILIDLAADMATREHLFRIMDGVGSPSGFLKLVVFYCVGNDSSPIDQLGQDFITDDVISKFSEWGIFCAGPAVSEELAHRLLDGGIHFVITFIKHSAFAFDFEAEYFGGLNVGILKMLEEGIGPSTAALNMQRYFKDAVDSAVTGANKNRRNSFLHALSMHWNVDRLVYYGVNIAVAFDKIIPGRKQATEFQHLVSKILYDLFSPNLDQPQLEVSNLSGTSRYDIVFTNRAERGFWHDIKISRGNAIVIFDAKNKSHLQASDADQMYRYAGKHRGMVVFIVCRRAQSKSFKVRIADLLKEHGVFIIVLTDKHLIEMHALHEQGSDPTIIIERLYRDHIQTA